MADSTAIDELAVTKSSDATSTALKGDHMEPVELHDASVTRATLEPGWGVEADRDGTEPDYYQGAHGIYVVSGTLGLELDDGARTEIAAGCAATAPPEHHGWAAGGERFVYLESDPSE